MAQSRLITETGTKIKVQEIPNGVLIKLEASTGETSILLLSFEDAKKLIGEIKLHLK